ncbi:hypothetical protein LXA43DRAFT_1069366 [Ganoderma leucocontextum]|nr:hypothetical protein LXA43DRAFT_1069366 [Ganoderma leucocontextum]
MALVLLCPCDILESVEESLGQCRVEQQATRETVDDFFKLVQSVRHDQKRLRVDLILALGLDKKLLSESDLQLSDVSSTGEKADEEEGAESGDRKSGNERASPELGGESGGDSIGGESHNEKDDTAGEVKPKRPKNKGKMKARDDEEYVASSAKAPARKGNSPAAKKASLAKTAQDDTSGEEAETEGLIPKSKKVKSVSPRKNQELARIHVSSA